MKEYQSLLDKYSLEGYSMYSKTISRSEWGNKEVAEKYLDTYWLPQSEYENKWKWIQNEIFINQETGLPKLVFNNGYEILIRRGGCLFVEDELKKLQECVLNVGDEHFVVVENTFAGKLQEPAFRLKLPTRIEWKDLTSGNFISAIFVGMCHKEYFVFGASGSWGKYAANDFENPLDIIGFKSEYGSIFREKFEASEEERREIATWVPAQYTKYMKGL